MEALMDASGVKFGTSGARGLVSAMTDEICYAFTVAFLQHLGAGPSTKVGIAGDRRASTNRIVRAVTRACLDFGSKPLDCGRIPTPAIALYGLDQHIPTIMVTGSHIPDDRNGIKFNKETGEILKHDEAAIRSQEIALPGDFDAHGMLQAGGEPALPVIDEPRKAYVERFIAGFPRSFLSGKRIVVYGHSAVGRDILCDILGRLGAEVVPVGYSEAFIPVDTEAIRDEDVALAARWAKEHKPFAIVSTDGDGDRPLIADEHGTWLRGDVTGILTAKLVGATTVVTPVTSNTAVEKCGYFERVIRTRIGSPYVIEEMERAAAAGARCVVGYEANGGFLTSTPTHVGAAALSPLPTRDAVIVLLGVLALAAEHGETISQVSRRLPRRFTVSDRLKNFPTSKSAALLDDLSRRDLGAPSAVLDDALGLVSAVDKTDGLRLTFQSGDIAHLRASGNAPELRCYAEADSEARAKEITSRMLDWVRAV